MRIEPNRWFRRIVIYAALSALAAGCRCNPPRTGATGATPTGASSPSALTPHPDPNPAAIPAALTPAAVSPPAEATAIDLAVRRSEVTRLALRGLDDGGLLLGLAVRWLGQTMPQFAQGSAVSLQRRGGGVRVERFAMDASLVARMERAEAGLRFVATSGRCLVHVGPVRARCPVEDAAAIRALAGLALLSSGSARPDADLVLEALHGGAEGQPVLLRLASSTLADRWTLEVDPSSGQVRSLSLHVAGRPARLTIVTGPSVRLKLQVADRFVANWTLGEGSSAESATEAPHEVVLQGAIADMAEAEPALARLSSLAAALGGSTTGPEAMVVRWQGGQLTPLAVQAPALLPVKAHHDAIVRLPTAAQSALPLRVKGGQIAAAMEAAGLTPGCYRVVVLGQAGDDDGNEGDAMAALRPCAAADSKPGSTP